MMWLWAAVASAFLLGFYDVAKKQASTKNDVLHILLYATGISTCFFLPLIFSSLFGWGLADGTVFEMQRGTPFEHLMVFIKSLIVSVSWITGLMGLKNLPITTAGTIKTSRPVFVLIASILLFGERLNLWQWGGVLVALVALWLLGRTSKKEGVDFARNKWIACMWVAVLSGVVSAIMDKYLMGSQYLALKTMFVQSWCNLYITLIMIVAVLIARFTKSKVYKPFRFDWAIVIIAVFIAASDFLYFYSLSRPGSMLAVVSMLRRSSVIVTFVCGALLFKEKYLREKGLALALLLVGMILLVIGTN
ncbi:MAG: EamA family transporter [Bacteroidales bacterium]|nr:EamA family transporter [Bacteroidales bacterium]